MDKKYYQPPSNLKPALLVIGLALIYPLLLVRRIFLTPNGIYGLPVARSALWLLVYVLQLTYHTIPFFTSPLNALPRPSDEWTVSGSTRSIILQHVAFTRWSRTVQNNGLILIRGVLHLTKTVLVTSPAALTEVLNTRAYDFQKPAPARRFLTRTLGTGLIVAEGPTHRNQRRAVAPAFQGRHIRELVPLFWSKAQQMVNLMATEQAVGMDRYHRDQPTSQGLEVNEKVQRSIEVEIGGVASRATLDIIGKAGFGRDFNTLENAEDELAKQYDIILNPQNAKGLRIVVYFAVNVLLPKWLVRYIPWKMNQRINAAALRLRGICRELIDDKKQILNQEKGLSSENSKAEDILSVLMRKQEIDDDELVNQMLTFLAAGHETTSNALTWCSYLLSANPNIQSRLREELASSPLADPSNDITADTIDNLPYLSAVCAELLRFYPTVPVTARVSMRTTRILDQVIPKGTEVILSPWATNRSPELWGEDADEFKPERWLKDGEKAMNSYEFITFLHGPRSCIGQGFARSELKCLLAALVLRFRLALARPGEVPEPAGAVTIKPKNGMRLKLTEIEP